MIPKKTDSTMWPKCYKKLKTLPGINTRINSWLQRYHNLKHSTVFGKLFCMSFELLVKAIFNFGLLMLFFTPRAFLTSKPVNFIDDFICHQLDFIEKKLTKDTGLTYVTENNLANRLLKFFILLCRIALILPRLLLVIISTIYHNIRDEVHEDIKLFKASFLSKSLRVRRSTKRVRSRRAASSPSAQRKRKHEDASDEEVYEYLYINESYQSVNDPDYIIGDTTFEGSISDSELNDEVEDDVGDEVDDEVVDEVDDEVDDKVKDEKQAESYMCDDYKEMLEAEKPDADTESCSDVTEENDGIEDCKEIVNEEGQSSEKEEEEAFVIRSPNSRKG